MSTVFQLSPYQLRQRVKRSDYESLKNVYFIIDMRALVYMDGKISFEYRLERAGKEIFGWFHHSCLVKV